MNLSDHFTLEEMTFSQTAVRHGLSNQPGAAEIENLKALCANVLEPLRALVARPLQISSGYRSPELNRRIGGAATSQHCRGEAADLIVPGLTVEQLIQLIASADLPVDQVIHEGTWLHVSHTTHRPNRRELLRAKFVGGRAVYSRF
ncbi:MAG TPA: D-Ala-D-Ala carboxypeptidase family metallohydrolase [Blastocatellia bacterium]|nr:D-Ala-D-Ala carboxypeptidase family metallohydrolase [Blastocatellia bacterium]